MPRATDVRGGSPQERTASALKAPRKAGRLGPGMGSSMFGVGISLIQSNK